MFPFAATALLLSSFHVHLQAINAVCYPIPEKQVPGYTYVSTVATWVLQFQALPLHVYMLGRGKWYEFHNVPKHNYTQGRRSKKVHSAFRGSL